MPPAVEVAPPVEELDRSSVLKEVGRYLAIAFGWSWIAWVAAIKFGLSEAFLNIGTAGPALAAVLLSRSERHRAPAARPRSRWFWFLALLAACWIVLAVHYSRRSGSAPELHFNRLLLGVACFPALIISGVFATDKGSERLWGRLLHLPNRWTAFALLFFPLLLGIPTAIAYAAGARLTGPAPRGSALMTIAAAMAFFTFNLLFVGVLEEPGWRGYLLDRLQRAFSPLLASFLVWLPWALWHAPLDYYRPVRFTWVEYLLLRVVFLIPLTIVFTWLYNRSGRSIQAATLFHATMNTVPFVAPYYRPAWVLIFVFMAYVIFADRMWRRWDLGRLRHFNLSSREARTTV